MLSSLPKLLVACCCPLSEGEGADWGPLPTFAATFSFSLLSEHKWRSIRGTSSEYLQS